MKTLQTLLSFVFIALYLQSTLGFSSGVNQIIANLPAFQHESGGFIATRDGESNLENTANALFLSSLFGINSRLNTDGVTSFLESLRNSDNGYGNKPSQASDLESVRKAILSYIHVQKTIPNAEEIGNFIHSLYDRDTKLFANVAGATGDLKSTALAFDAFDRLNLLQTPDVVEKQSAIRSNLESMKKTSTDGRVKYFSSITADNYYGIEVAYYVGLDLGNVEPWALYFYEQQVTTGYLAGGFYSDKEQSDVSVDDAFYAISALHLLQKAGDLKLVEKINLNAFIEYLANLPRTVAGAAKGFQALAKTPAFRSVFKLLTAYEPLNPRFRPTGHRIIQGSSVKPVLSIKSSFGLVHDNLDVTVVIHHKATGEKKTEKLTFNPETQTYTAADYFSTVDKLGDTSFDYTVRWEVTELGDDLVLQLSDLKSIGYDLSVVPKVTHAGKTVEANGVVGVGAEFSFDVKLGTEKQPKPSLTSGDFDLIFTVRDSSGVVIHEKVRDCRKGSGAIKFDYTLDASNIPAGDIKFEFSVSNNKGVHTSESLNYQFPVTMAATEIRFEGVNSEKPTYKIGDTITIATTPASLPDLRTVQHYAITDLNGKSIKRNVYAFIQTVESSTVLFHLLGNVSVVDGHARYTFTFPVQDTFASIGEKQITFHYEGANGKLVELQNFDSDANELFDDNTRITYKVDADLHLTEVKNAPQDGNLSYGNEVKFSFKVKDEVSGKYIWAGQSEGTVSLALRHREDGRATPFTSAKSAAELVFDDNTQEPTAFQVNWAVNPNAVKGKGQLELIAEGADKKEVPIAKEGSKDPWSVQVEVGGDIDVDENTYSTVVGDEDAVFVVEVALSCQKKRLSDALLKASVSINGAEVHSFLPVTQGGEQGQYQVSWLQQKNKAPAGEYTIQFYREVDRYRLQPEQLKPLFSVALPFHPDSESALPVKTEVLVALIIGAAFFWATLKKSELDSAIKKNISKKKR